MRQQVYIQQRFRRGNASLIQIDALHVPGRERDDISSQHHLVVWRLGVLALRRSMLAENATCEPLGNPKRLHGAPDAGTATSGAYQFPEAASFRISFSSVRSDTAFRRRAFSVSSSLSRLT